MVRGKMVVFASVMHEAYHELKIWWEALSSSGQSAHCVKKTTSCWSLSKRHFGWLTSQAWPRELETISFIFCLLFLTL